MNIDNLWRDIEKTNGGGGARKYDVSVNINKAGGKRRAIRFGFINNAVREFKKYDYMMTTSVEKCKDRIYFKPLKEETKYARKLTKSNGGGDSIQMWITPNKNELKIFAEEWCGRYDLKFDVENQLYYIDIEGRK